MQNLLQSTFFSQKLVYRIKYREQLEVEENIMYKNKKLEHWKVQFKNSHWLLLSHYGMSDYFIL